MIIGILIATLTSLFMLGNKSYWLDEAFSLTLIKSPTFLQQLWQSEPNMWLYYFILKLWSVLGTGEFVARLLSAIFSIASIAVIYLIGKELFNKKVGSIAAILTALHVLFVFYAQEARSYGLLLFLVSLSTYFFLKALNNIKLLPLYILFSALSVYTHLYGSLVVVPQLIFLLVKKKYKEFFVSSISIGILLMPLLLAPSLHSGAANWIPKTTLSNLVGTFLLLAGDFPPLALIYGFLLATVIVKKSWQHTFLLLWLILPVLAAFTISLVKPIYQSTYFYICLPPFILLAAEALEKQQKLRQGMLLAIIILLSVFRLGLWYTSNPTQWLINNRFEDWRDATKDVTTHMQKGDIVIFYGYYGEEPFTVYAHAPMIEISSALFDPGGGSLLPEPDTKLISSFTYPHVWVVLNRNTGDKLSRGKQWAEITNALTAHYHLAKEDNFYRVSVEEFTRD